MAPEIIDTEDDGEDDYGLPEPPSPAFSVSTDDSFPSYISDQVLHSPHSPYETQETVSQGDAVAASEGDGSFPSYTSDQVLHSPHSPHETQEIVSQGDAVAASEGDGSFPSYASEQVLHSAHTPYIEPQDNICQGDSAVFVGDRVMRTPRISRDEIRRRLMEQRVEDLGDIPNVVSQQTTPEASFSISSQPPHLPATTSDVFISNDSHPQPHHMVSNGGELRVDAPFDFSDLDVDLEEMHSALDRLMLGVETGFGIEPTERESIDAETATEGDMSASISITTMDIGTNVESKAIGEDMDIRGQPEETDAQAKATNTSEFGNTDDDTDEPITPPLDNSYGHQPPVPSKYDGVMDPKMASDYSLSDASVPIRSDDSILQPGSVDYSDVSVLETPELDLSISDLGHANPPISTSTPPRSPQKNHQTAPEPSQAMHEPSFSVTLPHLPSAPTPPANLVQSLSWDSCVLHNAPSQLPQSIRDNTFLARSSSTASTATNSSIPPPVPPKDDTRIQQQDEFVKTRKREMQSQDSGYERPATYYEGRPSRRRSLSTGDAEDLGSSVCVIPLSLPVLSPVSSNLRRKDVQVV